MRATKLLALVIFGIAAILMVPAMTPGQPGGKKKGLGFDPGMIFDRMANGRPSIPISELRWGRPQAEQYAKDKGITNGMINRQQYIEFSDQLRASGGGKGPFSRPGGGGPPPNVTIIQNQSNDQDFINKLSDAEFRRKDTNGDGKLNENEMGGFLRKVLAKYDKNGDGLIDMYEYREYYAAKLAGNVGGRDDGSMRDVIVIEEDELDRKPVVFRAGGQMPAGLPDWFMKLDTDGDGQVALYEWRKGGKNLDEFKEWDLNDDGFITPEEAIKCLAKNGAKGSTNSGAPSLSAASNGDRPRMNGKGGFGKKKKGGDQ